MKLFLAICIFVIPFIVMLWGIFKVKKNNRVKIFKKYGVVKGMKDDKYDI